MEAKLWRAGVARRRPLGRIVSANGLQRLVGSAVKFGGACGKDSTCGEGCKCESGCKTAAHVVKGGSACGEGRQRIQQAIGDYYQHEERSKCGKCGHHWTDEGVVLHDKFCCPLKTSTQELKHASWKTKVAEKQVEKSCIMHPGKANCGKPSGEEPGTPCGATWHRRVRFKKSINESAKIIFRAHVGNLAGLQAAAAAACRCLACARAGVFHVHVQACSMCAHVGDNFRATQ
eukprot:365293-Chlamydomonas_euryale.AAC.12